MRTRRGRGPGNATLGGSVGGLTADISGSGDLNASIEGKRLLLVDRNGSRHTEQ